MMMKQNTEVSEKRRTVEMLCTVLHGSSEVQTTDMHNRAGKGILSYILLVFNNNFIFIYSF